VNIQKGDEMDEQMTQQLVTTADRLANAAETLDRVLERLDAQQEAMNAKVDRIVAAVEERVAVPMENNALDELQQRLAALEKTNGELKAQAARLARKTLSPLASSLLAKNGNEDERVDSAVLDKTLQALSVEQRIAVKAEMARAGMIE
jgi:uncharacterized protein YpuA (DUF1002 family)